MLAAEVRVKMEFGIEIAQAIRAALLDGEIRNALSYAERRLAKNRCRHGGLASRQTAAAASSSPTAAGSPRPTRSPSPVSPARRASELAMTSAFVASALSRAIPPADRHFNGGCVAWGCDTR